MTDMLISLIILWSLLKIFFFYLRRSSVLDVIIKYLKTLIAAISVMVVQLGIKR